MCIFFFSKESREKGFWWWVGFRVCPLPSPRPPRAGGPRLAASRGTAVAARRAPPAREWRGAVPPPGPAGRSNAAPLRHRAGTTERKSGVEGKRGDLGGRRIIKKKKQRQ